MRRLLVAIAAVFFFPLFAGSTAHASPGDVRVLQGVVEWPPTVSGQRFAVIRGDDGQSYFVDLTRARRIGQAPVNAGDRVSVAGYEGTQVYEIVAVDFGLGDSAVALAPQAGPSQLPATVATPPGSSTAAPAPATAAPAPEVGREPLPQRLEGRVVSIAGSSVVLRSLDGRRHQVDVAQLGGQQIRAGDFITVFGQPRDDTFVATGFVRIEDASGSALPRER